MKKQTIKLNESQLRNIIKESVKKIIKEGFGDSYVERAIKEMIEKAQYEPWLNELHELMGYGDIDVHYRYEDGDDSDEPSGVYFHNFGDTVIITPTSVFATEGYRLNPKVYEKLKELAKPLQHKITEILNNI